MPTSWKDFRNQFMHKKTYLTLEHNKNPRIYRPILPSVYETDCNFEFTVHFYSAANYRPFSFNYRPPSCTDANYRPFYKFTVLPGGRYSMVIQKSHDPPHLSFGSLFLFLITPSLSHQFIPSSLSSLLSPLSCFSLLSPL